jgi:lipopolysaccharide/colanic/teichoic acid biosynthesis glycosyltransferase
VSPTSALARINGANKKAAPIGADGCHIRRSHLTSRLQSDLEYQAGWTIWRDISILISTFRVLFHKNAF